MPIPIIGPLINLVDTSVKGFVGIRKAKVEGKIAIAKRSAEGDIAWELEAIRATQTSWKDEYWTIVLSLPLIGAFIPPVVPYLEAGFCAWELMPAWFTYTTQGAILASFGIKFTSNVRKMFGKGL